MATLAPEFAGPLLDTSVHRTRGLTGDEIAGLVAACRHGRFLLQPAPPRPPRDPLTGVFFERLRHPKELLSELRAAGFEARLLRPDFRFVAAASSGLRRLSRLAGALIAASHPLSVGVAPWFELLGAKP